ncbi:tRNA(Ile)-lysidine synthase [Pilimelia terevasa]|uniref:tRNA(Ile)-lysidine synthase n=1 Tax=Pilimelia terevasa TaxID=53372 RepID=A0A8J3BCJ4_9ACTN|nr:tRNA lysidine(34) synthetase TilS [Pilimelia terevasa]GGK11744.1 tRNA(Ile)-lysidine synthase [Pilimelia terevasa]
MTGPPPAVAAVRVAVRAGLRRARLPPGALVLVACSGGADSLALAAAAAFVAPRSGLRAGLVTVDHGLQDGAAARAAGVARWAGGAGLHPAEAVAVTVAGPGGPEAAARTARYAALAAAASRHGAAAVLLGHTRDDQAETVLLALARGGGPRGLAGMPECRRYGGVLLLRPLLGLPRATAARACAELALSPWRDPHNADPAYARSRVRAGALPALVAALGEGVVANLARTAALAAADNAALDDLAAAALESAADGPALRVEVLAGLPAAVRTRVLRAWARAAGAPGGALAQRHLAALDALVTDWRGQGPLHLPGALAARRTAGLLTVTPRDAGPAAGPG